MKRTKWPRDTAPKYLAEALGPVGMVRFLQSFDLGRGDYTKERKEWLPENLDEIMREIEGMRSRKARDKAQE